MSQPMIMFDSTKSVSCPMIRDLIGLIPSLNEYVRDPSVNLNPFKRVKYHKSWYEITFTTKN